MAKAVPTRRDRPRIFYGWWIVLGGIAGMVISVGFNHHGLNAFTLPLADSFGISLATIVGALSLARFETAFIGPVEGYLVDRFGPRAMMFVGVPLMGGGFLAASFAPNFPVFLACFFLGTVLGSSLGFGSPISTAVANWWRRKRGRAFGILWIGTSLASVIVPLVNWMVETLGWRGAFRVIGLIVFVVGLPLAAIMRHRPEQYGMLPDGDDPATAPAKDAARANGSESAEAAGEADFTAWEALRTPTFWYFAISVSIRTALTTAMGMNAFPLVEKELHGTAAQAGFLFVVQGVFSAPGRVFLSWIGDSISKQKIMAGSLAVMGVCLAVMAFATSVAQITLLWVPYSIVWGGLSSLPNSLRADLFGRRNFASIQGAMSPISSLFNLVLPFFAAAVFVRAGTYRVPLLVFGVLCFVSMWLILMANPPTKKAQAPLVKAAEP
ncbi:MAG: MFS transporter [Chloroflexi bacterium]|nr:MFS transporter [Chloroflexota bacterium]